MRTIRKLGGGAIVRAPLSTQKQAALPLMWDAAAMSKHDMRAEQLDRIAVENTLRKACDRSMAKQIMVKANAVR
jgi:hypothetical protein